MKKLYKLFPTLLAVVIVLGCNTSVHLAKRKHRGGYHLTVSTVKKGKSNNEQKEAVKLPSKSSEIEFTQESQLIQEKIVQEEPHFESKNVEIKEIKNGKAITEIPQRKKASKKKVVVAASKKKKNRGFQLGYILLGAFSLAGAAMLKFKNRIFLLATWAGRNKKKARALLVFGNTALIGTSFVSGLLSNEISDVGIKASVLGSVVLGLTSFYSKDKGFGSLLKRKFSKLLIVSSLMGMMHLGGNSFMHANHEKDSVSSEVVDKADEANGSISDSILIDDDGENKKDVALQIFLSVLTVVVVAALLFGIAVVSCILACEGATIAAAAVLFGGVFISVFLGGWALLNIWHGNQKEDKKPETRSLRHFLYSLLALVSSVTALFVWGYFYS